MASVQLKSARSEAREADLVAEELLTQLGGFAPKLVILYASRDRDQRALNRALRDRLPKGTRLIGATTAGEIDQAGLHTGSVVLGALAGDFDVGLGLGGGLSHDGTAAGIQAVGRACDELGVKQGDLDPRKHVGVVIDDGFRYKKEELLLGVLERNQGLALVGGGASDLEMDRAKQSAELHVDGEVVSDAALVALFRTEAPWAALRSHWYEPSGQTLTITKLDSSRRRVLEIDGKPAAQRYADLIGVTVPELPFGLPRGFSNRPTALKVGREYFMCVPGWPLEDGSILFANLIEENSQFEILKAIDPVESTRRFLHEELPRHVANPSATLLFHGGGRMGVANNTPGLVAALSDTFSKAPTPLVGFNVQLEIYGSFHINTTLTTLSFGASA